MLAFVGYIVLVFASGRGLHVDVFKYVALLPSRHNAALC